MRHWIKLFENQSGWKYIGNCTNSHMAPYLENMMDDATDISYSDLIYNIGKDLVAETFPDFDWRESGDLEMQDDPNVSYHRSTFAGSPCYYVRESGIEYVFVPTDFDFDDAGEADNPVKRFAITEDGRIVPQGVGGAVFNIDQSPTKLVVSMSRAKTPASAAKLAQIIHRHKGQIIDDGERVSRDEFLGWLTESKIISENFREGFPLDSTSIPPALAGLAAEARKAGSWDRFRRDYLDEIKHGTYWHWTDDPNFQIDPEKGPRDMSSLGQARITKGTLMITSDLLYWEDYGNRPYVALIDMRDVPRDAYYQVNRGMGNEFWVSDPSRARVVKVYTKGQAKRLNKKLHAMLPASDDQLKAFYELATK